MWIYGQKCVTLPQCAVKAILGQHWHGSRKWICIYGLVWMGQACLPRRNSHLLANGKYGPTNTWTVPRIYTPLLGWCTLRKISNAHCQILPKIWPFLPCFSRRNWRVIFEVFHSSFKVLLNFYSTVRCLVWENEWNNWEMFTSSLRSHNFKSGNIFW